MLEILQQSPTPRRPVVIACPVARCARPANPGWTICSACADELEKAVAEVPALAEQLEITLTRQNGRGTGSNSRSAVRPLPYDSRASEAAWVLRSTLVGWVRDLEPALDRRPDDELAAMACWLLARMGTLVVHPAADEIVEELVAATTNAWRVVDVPADRVFLGVCPECRGEDLYAPPGATHAVCPACRALHEVDALRSALRAVLDDRLVTASEYAGMLLVLGVSVDRDRTRTLVNTWAARGRIAVHPGPTYRFGELQARRAEWDSRRGR